MLDPSLLLGLFNYLSHEKQTARRDFAGAKTDVDPALSWSLHSTRAIGIHHLYGTPNGKHVLPRQRYRTRPPPGASDSLYTTKL